MHDFLQSGELKAQAKRLLRYRFLLVVVILINAVMVLRVHTGPPGQAIAQTVDEAPTPAAQVQRLPAQVATFPQPADVSDTRRVDSTSSEVPPAAGQNGENAKTSQPASTNVVALLRQPAVASWRSKFAQAVATVTDSQPTQDFDWQPWTHPLVADWLHAAQELEREGTRHSDPANVGRLPDNSQVAQPPAASSGLPETRRDHTLVAPAPQTTEVQPSPTTLDAAGTALLLRNPTENNGVIRFLVNRRIMELQPGEAHQFSPADKWVIQFHPGGDFENVQRSLSRGTYEFRVTSHGWDLTATSP